MRRVRGSAHRIALIAEPLRTMFLRAGLLAQSQFPTLAPSKIFFRWEVILLFHPLALDRTQHVSLSDQQQETGPRTTTPHSRTSRLRQECCSKCNCLYRGST